MSDSHRSAQSEFRPVNAMLGQQPRFGPIPAEQLAPWCVISFAIYFVCQQIGVDNVWTVLLIFWGDATWWLLTGSEPWRFLSKFVRTPTWAKGRVEYLPLADYITQQQKKAEGRALGQGLPSARNTVPQRSRPLKASSTSRRASVRSHRQDSQR